MTKLSRGETILTGTISMLTITFSLFPVLLGGLVRYTARVTKQMNKEIDKIIKEELKEKATPKTSLVRPAEKPVNKV